MKCNYTKRCVFATELIKRARARLRVIANSRTLTMLSRACLSENQEKSRRRETDGRSTERAERDLRLMHALPLILITSG